MHTNPSPNQSKPGRALGCRRDAQPRHPIYALYTKTKPIKVAERAMGFEPTTNGLEGRRSTVDLHPHLVGTPGFEPGTSTV